MGLGVDQANLDLQEELRELLDWFKQYNLQINEAQRCQRLGIPYDNKLGTVSELDAMAVTKAIRINQIRAELSSH